MSYWFWSLLLCFFGFGSGIFSNGSHSRVLGRHMDVCIALLWVVKKKILREANMVKAGVDYILRINIFLEVSTGSWKI